MTIDTKRLRGLAEAAKTAKAVSTLGADRAMIDFLCEVDSQTVVALLDELQHERDHSKMLSEFNSVLHVEKRAIEDYCAKVRGAYTSAVQQLAAMTEARDEACEIAVSWLDPCVGDGHIAHNRIAELRKVGK